MKNTLKSNLIATAATLLLGFGWFYITVPTLNFKSAELYGFLFSLLVIFVATRLVLSAKRHGFTETVKGFAQPPSADDGPALLGTGGWKKVFKRLLLVLGGCAAVLLVVWLTSSEIFNASRYQQQLTVADADFQQDISEVSLSQIPIVDKDTAIRLGDRKLGEVVELTSQFEVSALYTQINLNNAPTRVSPLVYADIIKWFTNQAEGIPYYICIDMATQTTDLVELAEPMKYSPCEYFNRHLVRHLRFRYPTMMFDTPVFEVNDDRRPFWVVPVYDYEIGVLGGRDITGIILVDAATGDTTHYSIEAVPQWIDHVYPANLLNTQANNWGKYTNGFLNAHFGQKNVTMTTEGYNYLALDDDIWMYTGVTSVTADQSNLGFLLVNMRTKETKYYPINGADEYSAMSSAEGKVQEKWYEATFPILINVAQEPTYFTSLKDAAGLVKQFAFVSVQNYQIVGVGDTLEAAEESYVRQLRQTSTVVPDTLTTLTGTVIRVTDAVIDGNTTYYFTVTGSDKTFFAPIGLSHSLPMMAAGDEVTIQFLDNGDSPIELHAITVAQRAAPNE